MKKLLTNWVWLSRRCFGLAGGMALAGAMLAASSVFAQKKSQDLTLSSLEELMSLEVVSASKKEEKLFSTAAAVYVITSEEIRRSGLTSLPEVLRLVPGLTVERIDGSKYSISARGFNMRYANKLLVLIDGRSIYSPSNAGVYWESQDIPLDEVERIEVIRGPGGTLWGANAVNGVINIITKTAEQSQGFRMTTGAGSQELGVGSVRVGAKLGARGFFKFYGQYNKRGELLTLKGLEANDGQRVGRGGFRFEWQDRHQNAFTVQGEMFNTAMRETSTHVSFLAPLRAPINTQSVNRGGFVSTRWQREKGSTGSSLNLYYDSSRRETADIGESLDTFDVDWQQQFKSLPRQDIVWGTGFRHISTRSNSNAGTPLQLNPANRTLQIYSGFAQDDLSLVKDKLRFTFGAKVEHNPYSKFEFQPNVRLLWTPSAQQTVWLAVAKAVRTPVRASNEVRINISSSVGPLGLPLILTAFGNPQTKSEEMKAYELGYRTRLGQRFSVDFASYYNAYDRLFNLETGSPYLQSKGFGPQLIWPLRVDNKMRGETYGGEIAANAELSRHWQVRGSYSFLRMQLHPYAGSTDLVTEDLEKEVPRHQFQLHSYLDLPGKFEADSSLYYVSPLYRGTVRPAYTRLDVRLGWRWRENIVISLAGQNLLDPAHQEAAGGALFVMPSQVRRAVFGKVTWYR